MNLLAIDKQNNRSLLERLKGLFVGTLYCLAILFCVSANAEKVVVIPLASDSSVQPTSYPAEYSYPAGALTTTALTLTQVGYIFPDDSNHSALLNIRRPLNWDGISDIEITLLTFSYGAGTAQLYIRPRNYNDGDLVLDVPSINSTIQTLGSLTYHEFSFTVPADSFIKDWWSLVIQRSQANGSTLTHTNNVALVSVALKMSATNE